jgi:hypothetical protein
LTFFLKKRTGPKGNDDFAVLGSSMFEIHSGQVKKVQATSSDFKLCYELGSSMFEKHSGQVKKVQATNSDFKLCYEVLWIRIRMFLVFPDLDPSLFVRIRILPSTSKKSKKHLDL